MKQILLFLLLLSNAVIITNAQVRNPQLLAAGEDHSLEIRNGALWGWGNNSEGQLGDGTTVDKNAPGRIVSSKD